MKAYVINEFGDPSVFKLQEMPIPIISDNEVLIRIKATSINPVDYKFRQGSSPTGSPPFPAILHFDAAGIIEKVGSNVTHLKIGDEVYGMAGGIKNRQGCLAEYVAAPATLICHKPGNLSFLESAAVPLAALTAWESLVLSVNLKPEAKVLIHGGTGGVGHFALQLAKWKGARVYTTVGSNEKAIIAKNLGADVVINYHEMSVEEYIEKYTDNHGFDVVFDTVGNDNFDNSIKATMPRGHLVSALGRSTHNLYPAAIKGIHIHLINVTQPLTTGLWQDVHQEALRTITDLIENNKINVLVDKKRFKMSEVAQAHEYFENKKNTGKICLEW